MYDNNGRYPLYLDIKQYAERISQMTRTIDINIRSAKDSKILENINRKRKNHFRFSKQC